MQEIFWARFMHVIVRTTNRTCRNCYHAMCRLVWFWCVCAKYALRICSASLLKAVRNHTQANPSCDMILFSINKLAATFKVLVGQFFLHGILQLLCVLQAPASVKTVRHKLPLPLMLSADVFFVQIRYFVFNCPRQSDSWKFNGNLLGRAFSCELKWCLAFWFLCGVDGTGTTWFNWESFATSKVPHDNEVGSP